MQAEPLAKILRQPDLTRPIRDECDLRERSSGKRENCLLVDSVADNVKFYHVAWIFLVDDPAHSTQPGPQPACVVTLG
jgi:hypothetical protein